VWHNLLVFETIS